MNEHSKIEPEPSNALLLHGPLQLAMAKTSCWSCSRSTSVVAIIAADVEDFENGLSLERIESPCFVHSIGEEDMPQELGKLIHLAATNYRPIFSRTMDETTWANTCEHCGRLQGAFFLHSEPDGPFFGGPDNFDGLRIDLLPESVEVQSASYSF